MKKLLAIFFLVGLVAAGYTWWMFNKPHEDIAGMEVDIEASATGLLGAFALDASSAGTTYDGKIVRISGIPTGVRTSGDQTVLSFDDKGDYVLQCYLAGLSELAAPGGDGSITLKCKYAGLVINDEDFLIPADIKLDQCIIVN